MSKQFYHKGSALVYERRSSMVENELRVMSPQLTRRRRTDYVGWYVSKDLNLDLLASETSVLPIKPETYMRSLGALL